MPREAITGSTPHIDAADQWREFKRELPSITADVVARTINTTVGFTTKGVSLTQTLYYDSTPCHFGNSRLWILCPGCRRRVRILYLPSTGDRYYCRQCHDMTYESCNQSRKQRLYRRRLWIARKLAWG